MATSDINSELYGMTDAQLQAALTKAQAALVALRTGTKVVSISYAQGEGSRSTTFDKTDLANLRMFIAELLAALNPGVRMRRRRYITPMF
jgi:gpW